MDDQNLTLLEVELFTGRTHQIRVHLSSMGHPILGDELYGGILGSVKRQLLHAYKLVFTNPETGKDETVTTDLPEDMERIIKGCVKG
jgi:23S rRNA pseudouridine1911/1915/1917 synthase